MGIGDWGLGIGDWGLGPIPNPQFPIPHPQTPNPKKKKKKINLFYSILYFNKINKNIKQNDIRNERTSSRLY